MACFLLYFFAISLQCTIAFKLGSIPGERDEVGKQLEFIEVAAVAWQMTTSNKPFSLYSY